MQEFSVFGTQINCYGGDTAALRRAIVWRVYDHIEENRVQPRRVSSWVV